MSKTVQAGIVTAYGAAVRGGYTGTYDKFCSDLAELADVLSEFLGFRVTIETLNEGTQATASYNDGVLALGIPRGNTGNGIQRIDRISTQGLVKTYRITYTSGTYFDFQVNDGNGIDHTTLNADYTLTITYTDGTTWTSGSIRGATGATPNLTIGTVTTLAPSEDATAEITGTAENPVLNLGIPKGKTGEVSQAEFDDLSGTVSNLNRQISDVESALTYNTDNLLDFQTEGFWIGQDLDGVERAYAVSTAENIQVTGGQELYTALKDLSTDIFGTTFNIRVREYDANGNILVSSKTYSSINSANPIHYTLNAETTQIMVCLNTNNWQKPISPADLIALNPYIYAGFNSSITNATVYHKQGSIIEKHSTEIDEINSIIGTFLCGIIPRSSGSGFPIIDTTLKTFTLFTSMCLIDRRLANGRYVITSDVVCDYSTVSSTAVVFTWDIDNNTVVAFAFNAVINLAKFIPICLFRQTNGAVCANIPVNVDDRLFGGVDLTRINLGSVWKNTNVLTINHRGYSNIAPENTLPAFKLSKDYGFDGVETDVRFTSDGIAVLLHDATIDRTSNGTGNIADMTYEQVLQYDFGSWKSAEYAGTKIPTFEQFMKVCRRLGLHPYIEIKAGTEQQIKGLAETVILCGMKGKTTFISYNAYQLQYIKDVLDDVRLGLITAAVDATVITSASALKTNDNYVFIDLDNYTPVDSSVSSLAGAGLPLEVYVNGNWSIVTANAYLTGITTDTGYPTRYMYEYWNSALN